MNKIAFICLVLILSSLGAAAQFKNIKLDEGDTIRRYQPCEPSIAINLKNPKNIVAASVLNNIYVSEDMGENWRTTQIESSFGPAGDPVLVSDKKGNFYNFHLSNPGGGGRDEDWLDRIVCQSSKDNGHTWSDGGFAGHNPPKDQDKPWVAVHPKSGDLVVTWTQFDKYGSEDPDHKSNIMLSMSNDGKKWSDPIQLNQLSGNCLDDDQTTEGAVPAVAEDGKMFVAWAMNQKIFLDRSFDKGKMWLTNDIEIADQVGGWAMDIPGLTRCNGMPVLMIDNADDRYKGSLYLVYADQRNGTDDTDIWFMRSHNYGDNWTAPMRINNDEPGKHQFLPWIAVDQTTGFIYIVYYDRRDHEDDSTDVYLAFSVDGGASFQNAKISDTPFKPTSDVFFGDYTNIAAHKGIITPIWTRMDAGKTSVMTAIIKHDDLVKAATGTVK